MQHTVILTGLLVLIGLLAPAGMAAPEPGTLPPVEFLQLSPGQEALTPEQALSHEGWQPLPGSTPNFGYVTDVFWYRMDLPDGASRRILEIAYPHLDDVRFWLVTDGRPGAAEQTGDRLPFDQRPLPHPSFLFPIEATQGDHHQLLLRVQTEGAHHVPFQLFDNLELFLKLSTEGQLHSLYYGTLITITLFTLVAFLTLREKIYLYYLASIGSFLLLLASLRGVTFPLLWPDSPALQNYSILIAIPLCLISMLLFSRTFLHLRQVGGCIHRSVQVLLLLGTLSLLGVFVLDYNLSIWLSVSLALISCLFFAVAGPILWFRGQPQAGMYTLAWGALALGGLITGANMYGLLPNGFVTTYGVQLGSTLQAVVLTIALARRIYQERESRVRSREAELTALSAQRRAEQRVMDQAMRDSITGLPNRACFELNASEQLSLGQHRRWAVCVVRIESLAAVTKTLGHRNSDRLLELITLRLQQIARELPGITQIGARERDCLATLEPSTFAVLLNIDHARASPDQTARTVDQLWEPIDYLGMQVPMDCQVGVAMYPEHGKDLNNLVRQAYVAQEAPEAREKGLAYYDPARDPYSPERLTLVTELRRALDDNQLALWYQPKRCLRSGDIVGAEALIRWPARQETVPADLLVAVAEQSGLIRPLTRWVMENALQARETLVAEGLNLTVSVNISPNNLREPDFPLFVKRLMTSYRQHQGRLILEVTETSMMQDPENSLRTLRSLDAAGIPLAIDDFGSGYSSLSYLKQLPACEVKIDRSLITDLRLHPDDRIIVKTTIDMCHNLGYRVVAEGVEDEDTAELLRGMNCDMIQGYVLARPKPLADLISQLRPKAGFASHGRH